MALLSSLVVIWFDCLTFFSWTSWHKFYLRSTTASETLWSGYMLRRTVCFQNMAHLEVSHSINRATAGSKELAENMGSVVEEVRKFRDHLEVIHCSATEEWNHQIMCSMMRKNCKFFFRWMRRANSTFHHQLILYRMGTLWSAWWWFGT